MVFCTISRPLFNNGLSMPLSGDPLPTPTSVKRTWQDPSVYALRLMPLGTFVTRIFMGNWRFQFSLAASEHGPRVSIESWCGATPDRQCDKHFWRTRLIEATGGTRTNAAARNKAAKVDITSCAQHFSATPTTGPGAHRASYTMGNDSLSRGLRRPGRGLDHSL